MNDRDRQRNHHDGDEGQSVENREESNTDVDVLRSVLEDGEAKQVNVMNAPVCRLPFAVSITLFAQRIIYCCHYRH